MDTLRLRLVVWLPLVLAACGGGGSAGPGPASRTVAYVDSECREDAKTQTYSSQQTLQILNADRPPVTLPIVPGVSNLPASLVDMLAAQAGAPPGVGLCTLFGQLRYGPNSLSVGAFQRIGVSRDGSTVAFEVNLAFSYFLQLGLPNPLVPGEEGIYVVGADGSGLRRLGPPSRQASWVNPPGWFFYDISFSPDGRTLTFPDLGPGPDGETSQIFLQDVATGKRTQVTHLPTATPASDLPPTLPSVWFPAFLDDETVEFYTDTNIDGANPHGERISATVNVRDGSIKVLPQVAALESHINPTFVITGRRPEAVVFIVPGEPVNSIPSLPFIEEVFLVDGNNVLQLTNFRRADTGVNLASIGVDGQAVFFMASADPFGENPTANCQMFSIDRLGTNLRQLTHFHETDHSIDGCVFGPLGTGCSIQLVGQDPTTQALLFYSTCDPFGANPNGGQIFAMQPDGSGLRQLTETRGLITEADGTVTAELPGPFAFFSPSR